MQILAPRLAKPDRWCMLKVMTMRAAIAGLVFSGLTTLAPLAAGQVVILSGATSTTIQSISDDGLTVVGNRVGHGYYFWSASTGYLDLNRATSGVSPLPLISGDGVSMLARSGESATIGQPFVATAAGESTFLPRPFSVPAQAFPTGISRDGSVVSGWDETNQNTTQVGWRWSASGGMQLLPFLALAMSGDGSTIFGSNGFGQHLMWRDGVTTTLPANFPGRVQAANHDGNIFGGDNWIWNHGQVFTVPNLPGTFGSTFSDINEDGTVAVGIMSDGSAASRQAFVWTPSGGTQPLGAYFASYGYDLSAYRITNVHVSADGRTFGMSGVSNLDSLTHGIIVTVPCPGAAVALAGLLAFRQRRR